MRPYQRACKLPGQVQKSGACLLYPDIAWPVWYDPEEVDLTYRGFFHLSSLNAGGGVCLCSVRTGTPVHRNRGYSSNGGAPFSFIVHCANACRE